jgi:hypothetical protein
MPTTTKATAIQEKPTGWEAPGETARDRQKEHIRALAFGRPSILIRAIAPKKFDAEQAAGMPEYQHLVFTRKNGSKAFTTFQGRLYLDIFSYQPLRNHPDQGLIEYGPRIADGLGHMERVLPKIYGKYMVVNESTAYTNETVTAPTAIFYEIDDLSIDEQWGKLRGLEQQLSSKASLVVETGKSLHCYFQLVAGMTVAEWKVAQNRLNDYLNADRTIKNPARLMRLPGFNHVSYSPETEEFAFKMVRVLEKSKARYELKDFDWVPESDQEKKDRLRTEKIEQAKQAAIAKAKERGEAKPNFTSYDEKRVPIEEVIAAVAYLPIRIPGAGTYGLCRDALWGLCDAVGISEAARLYEQHSPSGGDWDVRKVAGQFRPGDITSGTFWWFAKQGGYYAPIRQQTKELVLRSIERKAKAVSELETIRMDDNAVAVYSVAKATGKKFILDKRLTGAGKSHMIEEISDPLLYCSPTPYNPATEYLFSLPKLPARHAGRYLHPDKVNANGEPFSEAIDNGGKFVPGNCINTEEANLASAAGVEIKVCAECPVRLKCIGGEPVIPGGEPGYLSQIAKAKAQPQSRLHTLSLPRIKEDSDVDFYAGKTIVFDDISVTEPTTKKVGHRQVLRLNKAIQESSVSGALKAFFKRMADLSLVARLPENKWGLPPSACKPTHTLQELGEAMEIQQLQAIELGQLEISYPAMGDSLVAGNGIKTADVRAFESARNDERREAIINAYKHGGIGAIVNPLIYHPTAVISFDGDGDLLMAWHDGVIGAAMAASEIVWISDATGSTEDIMQLYNIHAKDLLVIESTPRDNANVGIVEVTGLGSLTRYTAPEQVMDSICISLERAAQLGPGKVGLIISHDAAGPESLDALTNLGVVVGKPHSDSRGSNRFQECTEIYAATSFVQNKLSLAQEFSLIYKQIVDPSDRVNADWLEFCYRKQAAEVIQFCGRLRHTRRKGEYLRIVLLGSLPEIVLDIVAQTLAGAEFQHEFKVDFEGITLRVHEQRKLTVFDAVVACHEAGDAQITWAKLAEVTGLPTSTIRSIFTDGGKVEPSVRKQQLYDQIENGACYLPSQKLQLIAPVSFERRNRNIADVRRTEAQIEQIVDATVAYVAQVRENEELAFEILPAVDPDHWAIWCEDQDDPIEPEPPDI